MKNKEKNHEQSYSDYMLSNPDMPIIPNEPNPMTAPASDRVIAICGCGCKEPLLSNSDSYYEAGMEPLVAEKMQQTDPDHKALQILNAGTNAKYQELVKKYNDMEQLSKDAIYSYEKLKNAYEEIVIDYAKHVTYTPYDFEEFVKRCKVLAGLPTDK